MAKSGEVVWYWVGGTKAGAWRYAFPGCGVPGGSDEMIREIERMGYVAMRGDLNIGPPEGPPSADRLAAVLSWRRLPSR